MASFHEVRFPKVENLFAAEITFHYFKIRMM
jgi:hypothetical protein